MPCSPINDEREKEMAILRYSLGARNAQLRAARWPSSSLGLVAGGLAVGASGSAGRSGHLPCRQHVPDLLPVLAERWPASRW